MKHNLVQLVWVGIGLAGGLAGYFFSPATGLALIFTFLILLLALRWPKAGILFVLLYPPLELHAMLVLPGFAKYVDELVLLTLVAVLLYRLFIARSIRFVHTKIDIPLAAFVATGILSILFNRVPLVIGIAGLRAMLQYALLYYVVIHQPFSRNELLRFVHLIMVVAAVAALYGFAQLLMGVQTAVDWEMRRYHTGINLRIFSTMGNPNTFGAYLVMLTGFTLNFFFFYSWRNRKPAYLVLVALLLSSLLLTYSRMSFLSFMFVAFAFLIVHRRQYIPFLLAAAVTLPLIMPQRFWERLLFAFSPEYIQLSLKGGRLFLALKSLEVVRMSPIFGVGPGRFGGSVAGIFTSPLYRTLNMPYHMNLDNFYFQVWTEMGTIGLLMFLWLFISLFRQAFLGLKAARDPLGKSITAGTIIVFCGLIIQSAVASIWEVHPIAVYLWFFAACTVFWLKNEEGSIAE
jgi:O-antigen ligase